MQGWGCFLESTLFLLKTINSISDINKFNIWYVSIKDINDSPLFRFLSLSHLLSHRHSPWVFTEPLWRWGWLSLTNLSRQGLSVTPEDGNECYDRESSSCSSERLFLRNEKWGMMRKHRWYCTKCSDHTHTHAQTQIIKRWRRIFKIKCRL